MLYFFLYTFRYTEAENCNKVADDHQSLADLLSEKEIEDPIEAADHNQDPTISANHSQVPIESANHSENTVPSSTNHSEASMASANQSHDTFKIKEELPTDDME